MQKTLINWISDLLWPHRCLGCGVHGVVLCVDCLRSIPAHPTVGLIANSCAVTSGGALDAPLLSSAVWHLKYRNMPSLAPPLAAWLASAVNRVPQVSALMRSDPLLVPVPLHPRRVRERGYNQAELLTRCFASITETVVACDVLARIRHTPSQVGSAGRTNRIANMADAFAIRHAGLVEGRRILLVDDVVTTGATLGACASALKAAGACTVTAVVLARA